MPQLSELRTRLARRALKGTTSSALNALLDEAINAAAVTICAQGTQYGIAKRDFVAESWGDLTGLNGLATTKGSTTGTIAGASLTSENVFPGDIIEDTISGTTARFLIYELLSDTTVDLGAPARAGATGSGATIHRRTIKLPSAGPVIEVTRLDSNDAFAARLEPLPLAPSQVPFKTGTPRAFTIAYDTQSDAAFLSLWPVPTSPTKVLVQQALMPAKLVNDGDLLDWPEPAIHALLELAHESIQVWLKSVAGPVDAQAIRDQRRMRAAGIADATRTPTLVKR